MHDPNDIGQTLHLAREKRQQSLMDVSHHTRIPVATIEALEKNDYSNFSSPTYAKSFLAQYCDYLDVDAEAWLDSFEDGDTLANLGDYGYLSSDHATVGDREPVTGSQSKASAAPSNSRNFLGPAIAFLIGVGVVGGGLYAIAKLDKAHSTTEETVNPPVPPPPVDETDPTPEIEAPTTPVVVAPQPNPAPEPEIVVPQIPIIPDRPPPVAVPVTDPDLLPPPPATED